MNCDEPRSALCSVVKGDEVTSALAFDSFSLMLMRNSPEIRVLIAGPSPASCRCGYQWEPCGFSTVVRFWANAAPHGVLRLRTEVERGAQMKFVVSSTAV